MAAVSYIRNCPLLQKRAKKRPCTLTPKRTSTVAVDASHQPKLAPSSHAMLDALQTPEGSPVDADFSDTDSMLKSCHVRSTPPSSLIPTMVGEFGHIKYYSCEWEYPAERLLWLDLAGSRQLIISEHAPVDKAALDLAEFRGIITTHGDEAGILADIFHVEDSNVMHQSIGEHEQVRGPQPTFEKELEMKESEEYRLRMAFMHPMMSTGSLLWRVLK